MKEEEKIPNKKKENQKRKPKPKVSTKFSSVLAIISIIGFLEIILKSFFSLSISDYSSFFFLMTMGIGLLVITRPKKMFKKAKKDFNETSFTMLTTFVLGCMTIIAAILSFPLINLEHPILSATLGIISVISIIFIVFQAWVIKE
jgi:cation transport ATPase